MARIILSIVIVLVSSLSESRGQESGDFPLKDCHTGIYDVLIITQEFINDDFRSSLYGTITSALVGNHIRANGSTVSTVRVYPINDINHCYVYLTNSNQEENNLCHWLNILPYVRAHTNAQTMLRSYIQLARVIFTADIGVGRQNSTFVAIIIVDRHLDPVFGYDDIINIPHVLREERSELKLFVLIYDAATNFEPIYLGDALFVPGLRLESIKSNYQILSLALCKHCLPGWFMLEYKQKRNFVSCYNLNLDVDRIDWLGASEKCKKIGANLASVESIDELDFLEEQLFVQLLANRETITSFGESHANSTSVYIGLKRNSKTVAQLFQWELKNPIRHRPLVIDHWLLDKPDAGLSYACGVWLYDGIFQTENPVNSELTNVNSGWSSIHDYIINNDQGWSDVGCGMKVTKLSLCELTLSDNLKDQDVMTTNPANNENFNKALNRQDFREYNGSIVSVSAYTVNEEFQSFLRNNNGEIPMFDCGADSGKPRFISFSYVCDGIDHCRNRYDENRCSLKQCETSCRSGECIPVSAKCDMFKDCEDGSDEEDCTSCIGRRSCDGTCLPEDVCFDGLTHCAKCSILDKRLNYEGSLVSEEIFLPEMCAFVCNRDDCINQSKLNDGILDCTGPEGPLDETIGKLPMAGPCYNLINQIVWAPECVFIKDRYGSVIGCPNHYHLQDCESFTCQEGYVKCPGRYCIPLNYVLDGKSDCPMGEDERDTGNHTCIGNFACWNSKVCLHPDLICDGRADCPYKEDELNCDVSCPEGFHCVAGTVTLEHANLSIQPSTSYVIDYTFRYLDLSGIDLSTINVFCKRFNNVFDIKLSGCRIMEVNAYITKLCEFLLTVRTLDLSYNLIKYINMDELTCDRFGNLRTLNLSFNEYLETFVIRSLFYLETLDLSHTGLSYLDEKSFRNGFNLKHLNLSYTKIVSIHKHTFSSSFTLETLDLRGALITQFPKNIFNGLIIRSSLYADNFGLCCPQVTGPGIPRHTCYATDDAISSCFDLIGVDVQRIVLWLVGVAATVGNLTVIAYRLIWDRTVLMKAYGLFVLNLGISDLIMGLYLLLIAGADVYYRGMYVFYNKIWKESLVCKTAGFLATLSIETSTFFILLITVDRFLVLKFPFGQREFSRTTKIIAVVLAWGVGFVLALIPVLPIFGDESIFSASAMCIGLPLTNERVSGWEYSFSVFIILNCIMFLIIAFGQAAIFRLVSENRKSNAATNQNSLRRAQNINVAKELSLVVLSSFLCWFPVGFMGLLSLSGQEIGNEVYAWTVVLVLPVNSALNPLLYTIPVLITIWKKFKYRESISG